MRYALVLERPNAGDIFEIRFFYMLTEALAAAMSDKDIMLCIKSKQLKGSIQHVADDGRLELVGMISPNFQFITYNKAA